MNYKYQINIWWSEEDNCYIANVVELGEFFLAHGNTYNIALSNIEKALELHLDILRTEGKVIPKPIRKRKSRELQKS